ncbi:pyrroline-5-carboxylate reductase 3 isoform X2 [Frankliniella occidentalis]|uniref:Pyrroline-5-carboxylate reductase n=1 Tax=Frankliniella occidentalis TaxID=133901 RepID=A0A9C6WZC2_FRAOC|nr:pyrroline-5-carboxylate reductase 3 isoform X2 [Frankliniella occidentalis]
MILCLPPALCPLRLVTSPSCKNFRFDIRNTQTTDKMDQTTLKDHLRRGKLGFIGAGKMAQAIADGLVSKGLISPSAIFASAPSDSNLKSWRDKQMNTTHSNDEIVKNCGTIFLAVKPQYLNDALSQISASKELSMDRLFVSVIAGISTKSLEEIVCRLIPSSRVIRVMPNTPMLVGSGCSVFCAGSTTIKQDILLVNAMLSELGLCVEVKESLIGPAGALSGCGPAFMYLLIEGLADGGVKMGVPRDLAQLLAAHTMAGAAQMVLQTGRHPGQLKDEVCSPGGSTIAGVRALEDRAVRSAMMAAVEAATLRSAELGNK